MPLKALKIRFRSARTGADAMPNTVPVCRRATDDRLIGCVAVQLGAASSRYISMLAIDLEQQPGSSAAIAALLIGAGDMAAAGNQRGVCRRLPRQAHRLELDSTAVCSQSLTRIRDRKLRQLGSGNARRFISLHDYSVQLRIPHCMTGSRCIDSDIAPGQLCGKQHRK